MPTYVPSVARAGSDALVLDLETVPDEDRWSPPKGPEGAPSPFPPNWAHRIVVIGYARLDRDDALIDHGVIASTGDTADARERTLIEGLSRAIDRGPARARLVTFNGRGFDLPVIALRALGHGVALPWYYGDRNVRARHHDEGHLDLCDWLADHGATRTGSLDAIARLVGLPGKQGVDGSQVEGLYRAGDLAAIEHYCLRDVAQTAFLYLRFRLLQGRIDRAQYAHRAAALFDAFAIGGRVAAVLEGAQRDRLLLS